MKADTNTVWLLGVCLALAGFLAWAYLARQTTGDEPDSRARTSSQPVVPVGASSVEPSVPAAPPARPVRMPVDPSLPMALKTRWSIKSKFRPFSQEVTL